MSVRHSIENAVSQGVPPVSKSFAGQTAQLACLAAFLDRMIVGLMVAIALTLAFPVCLALRGHSQHSHSLAYLHAPVTMHMTGVTKAIRAT